MRARLSSHRRRRRLAWTATIGVALALVAAAAIRIGDTGRDFDTPRTDQDAWVYTAPKLSRLDTADRRELFAMSSRFVQTAVARRNLDDAWELLGPEMRAGQTRRSWLTGFNNVVPFPVAGIASWNVLYSYEDDVGIDLALVAVPHRDIVGKTFTIELKRYPRRGNRWLVASWVPKGLTSSKQSLAASVVPPPPPPPKAPLSAAWLLVPLSVLGLFVLVPLLVALRSLLQHRRAAKRYERDLGGYSSSSSPS